MIGIHQWLEGLIEAALELELHHDLLGDVGHVEQHRDQVTLLAVILIVIIVILDEVVSPGDVAAHILEISRIKGIRQDEVVGHSLD